jgi:hypothetical protein
MPPGHLVEAAEGSMTEPTHETGLGVPSAFTCDGHDRHQLGMPLRQAAMLALGGVALIGLDLALHLSARALGAGVGLLLVPLIGVLFARWVDGPVLYYRSWGRLHRLPLESVTAVTAGKPRAASRSVALSAPGLAKPLRISLQSRGYVMSAATRQHLRGWLSAPHVQWTAEAVALFNGDQPAPPVRRRRRLLTLLIAVVLPLIAASVSIWLIIERNAALAIPGAPGYSTFAGPHGKPLPVGRPWGRPCQPIRFTVEANVPGWVYAQIAAVVSEARQDGIDVTLENRKFLWSPGSLYYVGGQSPATTVRVAIFRHDETPPQLAHGQPEHIGLGWDTRLDLDGRNEDLTLAQADLWMRTLNGNPQAVRRSIRQLIAMTQGIIRTSRPDSAIADGSRIEHFTPADVAAMQRMSGCADPAG